MPAVIMQAKLANQVIAGMRWLGRQTGDPTATWESWVRGRAVPIPVGRDFVVVRLPGELGRAAVAELAANAPDLVGPVLVNDSAVEVLLLATPAVWQEPGAELIDGRGTSTGMIKCPPPGREADRRRWLFPPRALPGRSAMLADPYRLAEAVDVDRNGLLAPGTGSAPEPSAADRRPEQLRSGAATAARLRRAPSARLDAVLGGHLFVPATTSGEFQ